MARKSILFLTTELPYPPNSGGKVKSWNYLKDLSKRYDVSLACLLKEDDELHQEAFQAAIQLKDLISQKQQISRNPVNLLRSYLGFPSLNVFRNYAAAFQKKIRTIANNFDCIIVDHYEMFQYVPTNCTAKIVLHTHNAEFMLWQRMAELSQNPIIKTLLNWEASRVKKYEIKIFAAADLIYSTPSDIELYQKNNISVEKHQITYHLGNDKLLELPAIDFEDTELALTFMGTLSWEPNIDALLWFIKDIWPKIQQKKPETILYVMGQKGDPRIYKAAEGDKNIIFTGFVKDLDSYLKKTRVYIVPLRFGSGMKVKVLEGLYRGVPMVSTSVGTEGLAIQNENEVLIADSDNTFVEDCLRLLESKLLWESLRDNSRKIAAKKYKWQPLFERMDESLQKLLRIN